VYVFRDYAEDFSDDENEQGFDQFPASMIENGLLMKSIFILFS